MAVTLNELSSREISLLPPAPALQVCGTGKFWAQNSIPIQQAIIALYCRIKNKKPIGLSTRDCHSLPQIGNVVRWNVIEEDNSGELAVVRLNEPHDGQGGVTRAWYFSDKPEELDRYETFVVGKFHARRHDVYALIEDEWTRERSHESQRVEVERIKRGETEGVVEGMAELELVKVETSGGPVMDEASSEKKKEESSESEEEQIDFCSLTEDG